MSPSELIAAVTEAERAARAQRGLPPYHILDFDHFPFAFALDVVASFDKAARKAFERQPKAALFRVSAALAVKDYDLANEMMAAYRATAANPPCGNMSFGLPIEPSSMSLPPVSGQYPTEPALFLFCDGKYFQTYCIAMLASIAQNSPKTRVHLHLVDVDINAIAPVVSAGPLQISVTHEASVAQTSKYYGALRLIRFAEALEKNSGALWMSDVDALVTGAIDQIFHLSSPTALWVRPGRLEPWNQFSACLLMGRRESLPYFRDVANILKASLADAWWGIDQYALFSAWLSQKPRVHLLGPDLGSLEGTPGLFWYTAGMQKRELDTSESAYARAFRKYAGTRI